MRKILLIILIYFLPNVLWSCIDCGEPPLNFFGGITDMEVLSVNSINESFEDRYENKVGSSNDSPFFALKLNVLMESEKLQASNFSGYSCFACSPAPAYMASEIDDIEITFSDSFANKEAGESLRDFFVVDPIGAYTAPFQFMNLETYENHRDRNRSAESIYFLYNDSLKQNIKGIFTVALVADGIPYKAESEFVSINSSN